MSIFFITGTSGSGKSTLTDLLKQKLSQNSFEIYDFDQVGVPTNADTRWRKNTTQYWLAKAQENKSHNKSTIICGVSVPAEVLTLSDKTMLPLYFGFIKISDELIQQRLEDRGWSNQLIQDNINWAHYLEAEVKKTECYKIVDNTARTLPEQTAEAFIQWIQSVTSEKQK